MEKVCKLILLGNGSVGKTSICQRFKDDGFQKVYRQTVGLDFLEKKLEIRPGYITLLQVWDIGGQSISSKLVPGYVSGSNAIFICYDVTDPGSFRDADDWLTVARRHALPTADGQAPLIFLVGNKIDLIALRKVTPAEHDKFVAENGLDGGFFISAQSGENVLRTFYTVAGSMSGIELSPYELAFTDKVLKVTLTHKFGGADGGGAGGGAGGGGGGMSDELRAIEEADAQAEAKHRAAIAKTRQSQSGGGGDGCKCVIQ